MSTSRYLSSEPLFSQTLQRRRRLKWIVGPVLVTTVAALLGLSLAPPLPTPPAVASDDRRPSDPPTPSEVKPSVTPPAQAAARPLQVEAPTGAADEVQQALHAWADSWSRRDFAGYAAAYVPGFRGSYGSHTEWRAQRQARIVSRQRIEVRLSQVVVAVDGSRATVDFRQQYVSEAWQDDTRRTLEWQRIGDRWLIASESER